MSTVYACPLSHTLISLSGKDKLSYLHGQVTQDINKQVTITSYGQVTVMPKVNFGVFKLFTYQDNYYPVGSKPEAQSWANSKVCCILSLRLSNLISRLLA